MSDSVPTEWTEELLQEHVSEIVFDASEEYDPDCVLCQKAQALGLFDPYGDPLIGQEAHHGHVADTPECWDKCGDPALSSDGDRTPNEEGGSVGP